MRANQNADVCKEFGITLDIRKNVALSDLEVQEVVRCLLAANCSEGRVPPKYIFELVERILKETGNDKRVIETDYHIAMERRDQ